MRDRAPPRPSSWTVGERRPAEATETKVINKLEPKEKIALRYWRLSRIKVSMENYFLDRPFHKAASLLLDQVSIEREECLLRLQHRDRGVAA